MRGWKVLAALAMVPLFGAVPSDEGYRAFKQAMIDTHNDARDAVGVPALAWDDKLADDAQDWADHIARTGRYEHSSWPRGRDPAGEGENMLSGVDGLYGYLDMVGFWVAEKRVFTNRPSPDFSRTGRWQDAGHYAQMVWRGTTRIGCGLAHGQGQEYLVCRYSPAGNVPRQKPY
jgi:hypothetical protein